MSGIALEVTEVEGLTGIEPALSAWEAEVLPLNYSPAPAREQVEQAYLSRAGWPKRGSLMTRLVPCFSAIATSEQNSPPAASAWNRMRRR